MPIPFNDWYHHTEFTCWSGLPLPDDGEPPLPAGIRELDFNSPSIVRHIDTINQQLRFPKFTPAQKLRLALRMFTHDCILAEFRDQQIEVIAISVDTTQVNILARFPSHDPVHRIGLVKRHATSCARRMFEVPTLHIWKQHGLLRPITNPKHLTDTRNIIVAQVGRLASVWSAPAAFEEMPRGSVPGEW